MEHGGRDGLGREEFVEVSDVADGRLAFGGGRARLGLGDGFGGEGEDGEGVVVGADGRRRSHVEQRGAWGDGPGRARSDVAVVEEGAAVLFCAGGGVDGVSGREPLG